MDEGMETPEELLAKQHRKEKKDLQGVYPASNCSVFNSQFLVYNSCVLFLIKMYPNLATSDRPCRRETSIPDRANVESIVIISNS